MIKLSLGCRSEPFSWPKLKAPDRSWPSRTRVRLQRSGTGAFLGSPITRSKHILCDLTAVQELQGRYSPLDLW